MRNIQFSNWVTRLFGLYLARVHRSREFQPQGKHLQRLFAVAEIVQISRHLTLSVTPSDDLFPGAKKTRLKMSL